MLSVRIDVGREKKDIIRALKEKCFKNNGLVFGGLVRDEIISNHWSREFNGFYNSDEQRANPSRENFYKSFWDVSIHPESKGRMVIAKDVDAFFASHNDAIVFMEEVKEEFGNEAFYIPSENDKDESLFYTNCCISDSYTVKKCLINYAAGKTRIFPGHLIQMGLDIVYPCNKGTTISYLEPPFANTDLSCNMFVQDKNGVRISRSPGDWFKSLSLVEQSIFLAKTMNDMVNFKTLIVKDSSITFDKMRDVQRYLKRMTDEKFPWKIENLPYDLIDYVHTEEVESPEEVELKNEICSVCQQTLIVNDEPDTIAIIRSVNSSKEKIQGAKLHHSCLCNHLKFQIERRITYPRLRNEPNLVCPFKCPINFDECNKLFEIKEYATL